MGDKKRQREPETTVVVNYISPAQLSPAQRAALRNLATALLRPLPEEPEGQVKNETSTPLSVDGLMGTPAAETKPNETAK